MRKIVLLFFILLSVGIYAVESADKINDEKTLYKIGKELYDQKKYSEAYPYLLKAANMGNSDAMMHLGKMFYNGWGVKHNHATGRMWHERAAKLGNEESIRKLKTMDMHDNHHN